MARGEVRFSSSVMDKEAWAWLILTSATPGRRFIAFSMFSAQHLNRLSFIRRSRDLGFSLDQVRALLDLADQRDRPCEAADAIAFAHLAEIDRKIADLQALRRELNSMITRCGCSTIAECRIIESLSPTPDVMVRDF
jgi:hypothetical protein